MSGVKGLIGLAGALVLAGCEPASDVVPQRSSAQLVQFQTAVLPSQTPTAVDETISKLHAIVESDSLRQLARFADEQPHFTSNFAGERHFEHWYVLRRTGVGPLRQLARILDEPAGALEVGDETWFVWPDLAALPNEELQLEQMSFHDRARLQRLLGEEGVQRLIDGGPYPGFRTAISDKGEWIYYLQEVDSEGLDDG